MNQSILIDTNSPINSQQEHQLYDVLDYFGELEIAGLLNISNFAYFTLGCSLSQVSGNKIGQQVLDRTGKLIVILINEVSQHF